MLIAFARRNAVGQIRSCRRYATHRNIPSSSLLTSALNQQQHSANLQREDSVGPFQLGISQASLKRGERVKRWSELSTSGKVLRTTQRTTNLTVILLGAGISAVLVYALVSELFSKNSPTVLYNDACERIKVSHQVAKYLHSPLTFHNNPPSAVRPRHRHRHVTSHIVVDSLGREHMLLSFYVQGSPSPDSSSAEEDKPLWSLDDIASLSYEDIKGTVLLIIDSAKRTFRYLSGDVVALPQLPHSVEGRKQKENEGNEDSSLWGLAGLFKGLRGGRPSKEPTIESSVSWTEGEVHADLVRNDDGYFVFRYLLVDIPNSDARNPIRVYVERATGVRENEPIMRFHAS
ncbi:TIM21-domain-containing protein [Scleroderma citrinum]